MLALGLSVVGACSSSGSIGEGQPGSDSGVGGGSETGGGGGNDATTSGGDTGSTGTDGGTGTKDTGGGGTPDSGPTGTSSVTIIVEPNGKDNAELVAAINAAKTYVHMTMYEIDDTNVLSALTARKAAGVEVEVVLNQTFPAGTTTSNQPAYTQLTGAGVGVVWSSTAFTYTHEKTVIIDGSTAWIMTMNAEKSSPRYNREYLAIDTDATDVAEAEAIFAADYAGKSITGSGPLVVAPDPPNNARSSLVALIDSATTSLDVEVEEFSDLGSKSTTGVVTAVASAASRGVKVRVVLANTTPEADQTTAIGDVKSAGGSVVVSGGTSGAATASSPYIHAKAILVDCAGTACRKGFVGSENFSGGSLGYNRELGVFITAASELAKIKTAIDTDFAAGTPQ
jgi:phosphatidylserine/phosphatidylglycerophosphate/cardiolipin synthase-like enzyme